MTYRFLAVLLTTGTMFAQVDVLTRRVDNLRSGVNSHETTLTQDAVQKRFGKLWTLFADAKIMAQPLYVSNLVVPPANIVGSTAKAKCAGGCNAVLFATMKGTIYAYMADQQPATINDTLLWATYLSDGTACKCSATGPQNGSGNFDMWAVDDPWWGILGTPVIDRSTNSIYAVDWTNDQQYRVYRLDLTTGQIKNGPVVVQGTVGGQTFFLNTPKFIQGRKQRAGLLLANGLLYVGFGGDDPSALAGWLFVYDAATLTLKTVWSPTPNGRNGGIWMAGDAPAADGDGNVYLQTGDGDLDQAKQNFGDSLVKLQFQNGVISVAGFFAPCNQMLLQKCDLDQGSAGVVLFDQFVAGGGKNGELYLMRTDKMPGYTPGPFPPTANACLPAQPECTDSPDLVQKWQASGGHIHGST
jgi:outer membrane protein assembly factor BamB